jgi:hypothetical protein
MLAPLMFQLGTLIRAREFALFASELKGKLAWEQRSSIVMRFTALTDRMDVDSSGHKGPPSVPGL